MLSVREWFYFDSQSLKHSFFFFLKRLSLPHCSAVLPLKVKVTQSCPTLCDPMDCSPWNSPGQNTGVGSLSLLQGIFPIQGLNPDLPHCRRILYQLSYWVSPWYIHTVKKNKSMCGYLEKLSTIYWVKYSVSENIYLATPGLPWWPSW